MISKIDQFYIEIAIVDSIKIVGIRIVVNWRSNLKSEIDSTTTIWFGHPNRISLLYSTWCETHHHLIGFAPIQCLCLSSFFPTWRDRISKTGFCYKGQKAPTSLLFLSPHGLACRALTSVSWITKSKQKWIVKNLIFVAVRFFVHFYNFNLDKMVSEKLHKKPVSRKLK